MASSPTTRTLAWLRKFGWTAGITEHWNPHTKTRHDLFQFIDIVAMRTDALERPESDWDFYPGFLAVQATSGDHTSHRLEKIQGIEAHRTWLEAGGRIIVVGWRQLVKRNKDGSKAKRKAWTPKIQELFVGGSVESNF